MTPPVTPERWRRISSLLDQVLDLPETSRRAHLDAACSSDPGLAEEVLAYLDRGERAGRFLDGSPLSGLGTLTAGDEVADVPGEPRAMQVGPYRLLRRIGKGGMGIVYLATRSDGQFTKQVALKLVRRGLDTEEILERFRRERQILAWLEHPHIARILDGGMADDGRPYLVMEYVEGDPITDWCDAREASIDDRLRLFREVCETVQYAHRNLVIHRDLKPSNILVTRDGQVKLLDFGIAKLLVQEGQEGAPTLTRAGTRPMTPAYAAPELALDAPLTTAADVYSLGIVLHELLVGRRPERPETGERAGSTTASGPTPPSRVVARERPRAAKLRRLLRGDLDTIVLKALQPDPARRYRTVEALAEDLERHATGLPIRARRDTWGYRAGKFLSRHRVGAAAALLVALSIGAGVAGTLWQAREARREAIKAREVQAFTMRLFEGSDPHQAPDENLSARDLLDRGARRVDAELRSQPEIQAEMMLMLGRIDVTLGLYDRGRALLDGALERQRRLYGDRSIEAAGTQSEIGALLYAKGEYDASEAMLQETLALHETLRGPDDAGLAPMLTTLGDIRSERGDGDGAEQAYRRALDINRRALGDDHIEVAMNLSDLGSFLYGNGRYAEAEGLFRRALEIRKGRMADSDYDTQIVRHNLGAILAIEGSFPEAEAQLRKVLADRRKSLGPDHLFVAVSLDVLGNLLRDLGEFDEGEAMLREGLDIRRRAQGPDSPEVGKSLNNLAYLEYRRGNLEAARRDYERTLTMWRKVLPADHPNVLIVRNNLGMVQGETGDEAAAERELREVLAVRVGKLGDGHVMTSQSRYALGCLLARRGAFDEAEEMLDRALATRTTALGPGHFSAVAVREALAGLRRDQGRLDESLSLYRETLAADRATYAKGSPQTSDSLVGLGRTLVLLGRPAEAEPLLREGLALRLRLLVPGDRRTAEAMTALACALAGRGGEPEAKRLLEESLPILERRPSGLEALLEAGRSAFAGLRVSPAIARG